MNTKLVASDFLSAVLNSVSEALCGMGYEFHFIALPINNLQDMRVKFLKEENINIKDNPFPLDINSLAGRVFLRKKEIQCHVDETRWTEFWIEKGFYKFLGVPLMIKDHIFGVLTIIYTDENKVWSDDEINMIKKHASTISLCIQQSLFSEGLNKITNLIAPYILEEIQEQEFYNQICSRVSELFISDRTFIFFKDNYSSNKNKIKIKDAAQAILSELKHSETLIKYNEFYCSSVGLLENNFQKCIENGFTINDIIKIIEISRLTLEIPISDFDTGITLKDLLSQAIKNDFKIKTREKQNNDFVDQRHSISDFKLFQFYLLTMKGVSKNNSEIISYPYLVIDHKDYKNINLYIAREGLTARVARTNQWILNCCPMEEESDRFTISGRNDHLHRENDPSESFVAVPLIYDNELIGILRTENRLDVEESGLTKCYIKGRFSAFQKDFLRIISENISNTINSYRSKLAYENSLKTTLQMILDFMTEYDEIHLYEKVIKILSEKFNYENCSIFMIDKNPSRNKITIKDKEKFSKLYPNLTEDILKNSYDYFNNAYHDKYIDGSFSDNVLLLYEIENSKNNSPIRRTYIVDERDKRYSISGEGITAYVARTGNPVILHTRKEIEGHPSWSGIRGFCNVEITKKDQERYHAEECNTIVAVPMKYGREVIGVIKIESPNPNLSFLNKDKRTLEFLSSAIALTVKSVKSKSHSYEELFGLEIFQKIKKIDVTLENSKSINIKLYEHIMSFYHSVSGNIPAVSGETEIEHEINKLINLICRSLELPETISDLTEKFKNQEQTLYSIEAYRDHFFHQFHTFLLGYTIINIYGLKKIHANIETNEQFNDKWCDNFLKTWFLASMFHDVAYPIEKVQMSIGSMLQTMLNTEHKFSCLIDIYNGLDSDKFSTIHKIEHKISEILSENNPDILHGQLRKLFHHTHDHAIFSAIMLMSECNDEKHVDTFTQAAVAIACHNGIWDSIDNFFTFKKFPLGFLLTICDLLQEWSRLPKKSNSNYLHEMKSKRFLDIKLDSNVLECSLVYDLDYYQNTLDEKTIAQDLNDPNMKGLSRTEKFRQLARANIVKNIEERVQPAMDKWSSTGSSVLFSFKYYVRNDPTELNIKELPLDKAIKF